MHCAEYFDHTQCVVYEAVGAAYVHSFTVNVGFAQARPLVLVRILYYMHAAHIKCSAGS